MTDQANKKQTDMEWDGRILCSDESCIGVIGPEGRCRECGRPYEGSLPETYFADEDPSYDPESDSDLTTQEDDEPYDDGWAGAAVDDAPPDDAEWAARTLCPDESCIGVLGDDGRCLECGRRPSAD